MAGIVTSGNTKTVAMRPLVGGMRPDKTPTQLGAGEFLDTGGFIPTTRGIFRAPGHAQDFGGDVASYPPLLGFTYFYKNDGSETFLTWDQKYLYVAGGGGLTAAHWAYATGTARTSGTFLIGSSTTAFTKSGNYLRAADVVAIGAGASLESVLISSITSSHLAVLTAAPTMSHAAGSAYSWRRAFGAAYPSSYVDHVTMSNQVLLADGVRPMRTYNGSTYTNFPVASMLATTCVIPDVVAYFGDRIWMGRIKQGAYDFRQRIVWSQTIDKTKMGLVAGVQTSQFVDRPYSQGRLLRLIPLQSYLVAYFEDAIDFGRPTNIAGDTLPVSFAERLQTGGMGLVGPKAVCAWLDGHYFVSQDDIYFLSLAGGLKKIGTPVVAKTIRASSFLEGTWAVADPERSRIVFGFPETSPSMTKLWSYNYVTGAWSYEASDAFALGLIRGVTTTIAGLDGLSATISGLDAVSVNIGTLGGGATKKELIFGTSDGKAWRTQDGATTTWQGVPIPASLETGDFDFGEPERMKSGFEASVKIDRRLSVELAFTLLGSTNEGTSWRSLGLLTIPAGEDEARLNFQLTGATLRFRLVSSSSVEVYEILEMTLKIKARGKQAFSTAGDA